jgi:hypothetical protein
MRQHNNAFASALSDCTSPNKKHTDEQRSANSFRVHFDFLAVHAMYNRFFPQYSLAASPHNIKHAACL